jgi:hypothetical protein
MHNYDEQRFEDIPLNYRNVVKPNSQFFIATPTSHGSLATSELKEMESSAPNDDDPETTSPELHGKCS